MVVLILTLGDSPLYAQTQEAGTLKGARLSTAETASREPRHLARATPGFLLRPYRYDRLRHRSAKPISGARGKLQPCLLLGSDGGRLREAHRASRRTQKAPPKRGVGGGLALGSAAQRLRMWRISSSSRRSWRMIWWLCDTSCLALSPESCWRAPPMVKPCSYSRLRIWRTMSTS